MNKKPFLVVYIFLERIAPNFRNVLPACRLKRRVYYLIETYPEKPRESRNIAAANSRGCNRYAGGGGGGEAGYFASYRPRSFHSRREPLVALTHLYPNKGTFAYIHSRLSSAKNRPIRAVYPQARRGILYFSPRGNLVAKGDACDPFFPLATRARD